MWREAVSLDVWNTLLSTDRFFEKVSNHLALELGKPVDLVMNAMLKAYKRVKAMRARGEVDVNDIVGHSVRVLVEELGPPAHEEHVRRALARTVVQEDLDDLVVDDSIQVLSKIKAKRAILVVVSNVTFWPGSYTRLVLERLGFSELVSAQVYADEIRCLKPDPRAFMRAENAIRMLGFKACIGVHVGDNFREDFLGALSAGLKAILVDRAGVYGRRGEVLGGRGYVVGNLHQAAGLLLKMTSKTHDDLSAFSDAAPL